MTTAPSTPISNFRRRVNRCFAGGAGVETGSACRNLPSRSTVAPALAIAGASIELDSLLCSVISVGIGSAPNDCLSMQSGRVHRRRPFRAVLVASTATLQLQADHGH